MTISRSRLWVVLVVVDAGFCSGVSIGSRVYWWHCCLVHRSGEGYYLKAEDGGEDLVICNQVPVIFSAILNCTLSCCCLLKLRMRL